jgi:hypothetical protein
MDKAVKVALQLERIIKRAVPPEPARIAFTQPIRKKTEHQSSGVSRKTRTTSGWKPGPVWGEAKPPRLEGVQTSWEV